jgi:hypothetical protein
MSAERWESACLREMLELASGRLSDRKLDLFNLWCCHILRPYLRDKRSIAAVRYAEQHVDQGWPLTAERDVIRSAAKQAEQELEQWAKSGSRTPAEFRNRRVYAHASQVALKTIVHNLPSRGAVLIAKLTAYTYAWANDDRPDTFPDDSPTCLALRDKHSRVQEKIFRDIVGNPFVSIEFDPQWRTSDVLGLARAVYEDRAFDRLPILADALMDAGCADESVLSHCRGPGPHARGCWVVDLVLGKS